MRVRAPPRAQEADGFPPASFVPEPSNPLHPLPGGPYPWILLPDAYSSSACGPHASLTARDYWFFIFKPQIWSPFGHHPLISLPSVSKTTSLTHQPLLSTPLVSKTSLFTHQPLLSTQSVSKSSRFTHQSVISPSSVSKSGPSTHQPFLSTPSVSKTSLSTHQPLISIISAMS